MSKPAKKVSRRRFITDSASATAAAALVTQLALLVKAQSSAPGAFRSRWGQDLDRVWLGQDFWANPLQDWRVAGGRIECVNAAADRNVHLLTRQLGPQKGDLTMSVRVGRVG